jgi:hypothetical protein
MLAAAAVSILAKRWLLTCSSCGNEVSDCKMLKDLPERAQCPACSAKVDIDLARNVEMFFTPASDLKGFDGTPGSHQVTIQQLGFGSRSSLKAG